MEQRVIDIAICTYRRSSLRDTLESVCAQQLSMGRSLRIIVADNDEVPSALALVEACLDNGPVAFVYVHAPARNISVARNACLDAATAPLLAFIDDDEIATSRWLDALVDQLDATESDVVLGPAIARYPADAPRWAVDADLHSTWPVVRSGNIATGYCCNVLVRTAIIDSHRFDLSLGRSGGDDDVFFSALAANGAKITFAPDAVVNDPVPEARLQLDWLLRRAFRNGQTHARISISQGAHMQKEIPIAAAKFIACLALAVVRFGSAAAWRRAVVRGALHAGAVSRYLGMSELKLY